MNYGGQGRRDGCLRWFHGGWDLRDEENPALIGVGIEESSRFPEVAKTLVYSRKYPKACVTGVQLSERRLR